MLLESSAYPNCNAIIPANNLVVLVQLIPLSQLMEFFKLLDWVPT